MSALKTILLPGCDPAHFGRLGSALLDQEVGAPTLLVAELAGAALLAGRHQRLASSIDLAEAAARGLPVARRAGGGKTVHVTPGTVGVLLAVPPGAWPQGLEPDKVLNRCVRGLLRGLVAAGAAGGAFYFGRDFVSWKHQQIAVLSQDGAPSGTVLFEALVATGEPLGLPPGLSRAPAHGDPRAAGPQHSCLADAWRSSGSPARDFEAIGGALIEGWSAVLEATAASEDTAPAAAPPLGPPIVEDDAGWRSSGPMEVPIGFLEALVCLDGERIEAARLRGDFIAPAFVIEGLETALAGSRLELDELAPIIDAAFERRGATVVGIRELHAFARALLACRP